MDTTPTPSAPFSPPPQATPQPSPIPVTINPSFKFAIFNSIFIFILIILAWIIHLVVLAFALGVLSRIKYQGNLPIDGRIIEDSSLLVLFFLVVLFISIFSSVILKFPKFSKTFLIIVGALFLLSLPFTFTFLYIYSAFGLFYPPLIILLAVVLLLRLIILRRRLQNFTIKNLIGYYVFLFILCFLVLFAQKAYFTLQGAFFGGFEEAASRVQEDKTATAKFGDYEFGYLPNGMERKDVIVRKVYPDEWMADSEDEIGVEYSCQNSRYLNQFGIRGSVLNTSYKFAKESVEGGLDFANQGRGMFTFLGETNINSTTAYYLGEGKDRLRLYFVFDDKYWFVQTDAYCLLPELGWGKADIVQDAALRERVIQELIKVASSLKRV